MQVIKAKLSDEQKRQLKMTFNLMDADGGGTIDGEANTTEPQGAGSCAGSQLMKLFPFLVAVPEAMLLCPAGRELGNAFQVTGLYHASSPCCAVPHLLESLCSFVVPLYFNTGTSHDTRVCCSCWGY